MPNDSKEYHSFDNINEKTPFISNAPPPYQYRNVIPITNNDKFDEKYVKLNLLKAFDIYVIKIVFYENRLINSKSGINTPMSYNEMRNIICYSINKIVRNHSNVNIKYLETLEEFINIRKDKRDKLLIIIVDEKIGINNINIIKEINNSQYVDILIIPINVNISVKDISVLSKSRCLLNNGNVKKNIEKWIKDGLMAMCIKKYPSNKNRTTSLSYVMKWLCC